MNNTRQHDLIKTQSSYAIFPLWLKCFFIMLALIKLWLVSGLTLYAIGNNIHDDRLFINNASALLSGQWLGPYSNLTLAKGPFYPLWIAAASLFGIPLLLAQQLLYIAACAIFIIAVRPVIARQNVLLILWAILLFNPMSYTDGVMTRVMREGIYPALTLLVVACACGILARHDRGIKALWLWSTCLGFSLSGFWLTREEGIWIIPSVLLVLGAAVIRIRQTKPGRWKVLSSMCVLPFCIWLLAIGTVEEINKVRYGLFTVSEFKSHDFISAYGALSRVKHSHWKPYYPLPRETRERIYKVSPAFAGLAPFLEGNLGAGWTLSSCRGASICDDIGGGWFMWAFRDAVAMAGHYESAASAADYYRQLATEVNSACGNGTIECVAERASLMPPWRSEYADPLVNSLVKGTVFLTSFEGFQAHPSRSVGTKEALMLFQELTGSRIFNSQSKQVQINGWAFSADPASSLKMSVITTDGTPAEAEIKHLTSPDVYQAFLSNGRDFPSAGKARFEITTSCTEACFLIIGTGNHGDERIPIDGTVRGGETPYIHYNLDALDYLGNDRLPYQDNIKISILGGIGRVYQLTAPFLLVLSVIAYMIGAMNSFRTRTVRNLWLINTALLIAIGTRLLILSIIDATSFPGLNTLYLSPAYPLLLIFMILALSIKSEIPYR